ncbi:MAG: Hsp20/alpha crystallin family protein [Candidatus Daviesbacteria bacterium]|nr:Hsp20/alpha crystallin family protein [Candidatus Daviesbacteria bacterium]
MGKEENMDLLPWRPVESISGLRKEMDRLFERFFGEGPRWELFEERWAPSLDVSETKDEILVKAEVPGIDPKNISISLSGDTLTIKGEKKQEKEEKEHNFYRMERSWGSFSRVIRIPVSVQPDKIKASHKNGVLTITLPKSEEVKPKEISVEVS